MQFLYTKFVYKSKGKKYGENKMFTYNSYPNLPFVCNGWLPGGFTNFGGDTQCFTIPEEIVSARNTQIILNPLGQSLFACNYAPNQFMVGGGGGIPSQASVLDYVNGLATPIANNIASSRINSCITSIKATRDKLNAKLLTEGLSEDDKKTINEALDKLNELEEQLKELTDSSNKITPGEANKKVGEIEKEIRTILNNYNNIGKIEATNNETVDNEDADDDAVDNDDADDTDTEHQGTVNQNGELVFSSAVKRDIEDFYNATYRVGTDDEVMDDIVQNKINKDNVMDYMAAWNKYHSGEKGESFMEAFMYDANEGFWGNVCGLGLNHLFGYGAVSDQKVKGCRNVAYALREKAEELGIYDECRADFDEINNQTGSWLWMKNKVYQNFDNIIKKIAECEKMDSGYKKYSEPQKS